MPSPNKDTKVNNHPEVTPRSSTQWIKFIFDFSIEVGCHEIKYRGGQFYWWGKPEYPEKKTTDLPQATDKLYYIMLYRSTPPRHEQSSNSQLLW
jgi:hypothetical protein